MSLPTPRLPARGASQSSVTPRPTSSASVEPKSEYLRYALEAKRAKNATPQKPTPTPETKPPESTPIRRSGSDPWLDQAKSEDDATKPTPMRRPRRPSDGGLPRMRTQRELQAETDKMRDDLFELKMRLQIISEQNRDLKDQMEEAQRRIEELEPLEEENHELRDTNNRLTLKLQDVTEEAVELRDQNTAILKIQDESVANMEKQYAALEEATEIILRMEGEKSALALENSQLKDQVTQLQTASSAAYPTALDGSANKYPSRVYSIDESRPSTSHFDSDYYSQPASPQVKVSKESLPDVVLSDRARNFLSMKKDGHKSIQDLKKRLSDASLQGLRAVSPVPEVPPIPESYQEQPQKPSASRTPRRSKPSNQLSPALAIPSEPGNNQGTAPRTPTGSGDGLRGMFRGSLTLDTSARKARPTPSHTHSPLATRAFKPSRAADRPTPPGRQSSRRMENSNSQEQLGEPAKMELGSDSQLEAESEASEWASLPPPPSIISNLTSELDSHMRERWWRDVGKLQHGTGKERGFAQSLAAGGARQTPRGSLGTPYIEKDFFFNGAEDEDQFMRRAQSFGKKR